ncbi:MULTISPECIES: hypothetical protein [Methylobacterium]|uniref:Flagellar protein FlaG n=2 Tax=Methylobacterium TaxID=407 RepID=A0AAV4Z4G2_9HYPH|nr:MULTISPECIES: hypothetical protein [Methylobacterium]KQP47357.1 hypothetical protein ASF34_07065 [Methylobacterium sp. Leaf106]TXN28058.1 hypothetical protein FV220_09280 [Methylobacterium sp. WL19]GJD38414.1 hypothetical protein OICFNHDK_0859 [Methylobacterium bullatum]
MTILSISPMSMPTVAPVAPIVNAPAPVRKAGPATTVGTPLDPPVRFDVRLDDAPVADDQAPKPDTEAPTADERRITVDQDTKSLVYQVVDPNSGDVVVQLPEATILRARAYAEATAMRAKEDQHPLDRTA